MHVLLPCSYVASYLAPTPFGLCFLLKLSLSALLWNFLGSAMFCDECCHCSSRVGYDCRLRDGAMGVGPDRVTGVRLSVSKSLFQV